MLQKFQELSNFEELLELLKLAGSQRDSDYVFEILPGRYEDPTYRQQSWFVNKGSYECTLVNTRRSAASFAILRLKICPNETEVTDIELSISLQGDRVMFRSSNCYEIPPRKLY
jgi:hypothetical protein